MKGSVRIIENALISPKISPAEMAMATEKAKT
jgi:hypothetical protein